MAESTTPIVASALSEDDNTELQRIETEPDSSQPNTTTRTVTPVAEITTPTAESTTPIVEPALNDDDQAELRRMEEEPESSQPNKLQALLSQCSHLNLSGRVHSISAYMKAGGGHCDVFTGLYTPDGLDREVKVAVKRLRANIQGDPKLQKTAAKELYIWSKLKHPNILRLEGFYIESELFPTLVSRWMEEGTIMDFLKKYPVTDLIPMVTGIAQGLQYLHANEIVHSDVKPGNIVMSEEGIPLLCDFGISRILFASQSYQFTMTATGHPHGTTRFMSKELLTFTDLDPMYSKASDVWAFGMTVYSILTKRLPYHSSRGDAQVIAAIIQGVLPSRPDGLISWPVQNQIIWHLVQLCWRQPTYRPPMKSILAELLIIENMDLESHYRDNDLPFYTCSVIDDKAKPLISPALLGPGPPGIIPRTRSVPISLDY